MKLTTIAQILIVIGLAIGLFTIKYPNWRGGFKGENKSHLIDTFFIIIGGFGIFLTWTTYQDPSDLGEWLAILSTLPPVLIIFILFCIAIPVLSIIFLGRGIRNLFKEATTKSSGTE